MKHTLLLAAGIVASTLTIAAHAADGTIPIASPELVFDEVGGIVSVEAEHFYKQTLGDKRAWHITTTQATPDLRPDGDPPHAAGARGGAYTELLPDTRVTHGHKMVYEENFTDRPGALAVAHYKVHVNTPGRYYVWVRSFSTGSEDNGVHVGLDGQWPESGQRWQTVQKHSWTWDCRQRTPEVHTGVPMQLFLDIEKAGEHEVMFSLREDGFEMDAFVLSRNKDFTPEGQGPAVKVKTGSLPAVFPEVPATASAPKPFPAHWGEPPVAQTRDWRQLPGAYGEGSGTLADWIQGHLDKDAAACAGALTLEAPSFSRAGTGYYLDQDKWLAINPADNKTALAKQAFPFPSGCYDVTLEAVGEEDGNSTYTVAINDQPIGAHECPLASSAMEEGRAYHRTWKNHRVDSGDIVAVGSTIASADGREYSRARWSRITFLPADDATKAAASAVKSAVSTAPRVSPPGRALPPLVLPRQQNGTGAVAITGDLKEWHKVTLTLDGPYAHEQDNDPNPFTDHNLTVTFTHESGSPRYAVPGYFAADGAAGESSAEQGTKWRAHLAPDKAGTWTYAVSFTRGKHAALDGGGAAVKPFDGATGSFTIGRTDKKGRDFRAHGRLQYVGKHFLQFAESKKYFLKVGADSPETLLAYADFDNTQALKPNAPLKTWKAHERDFTAGDPTWKDVKGKALIGALNYLAGKGMNAFSFLTYNAGGDGDNVWPFVSRDEKFHWDCSKLDQWGVIFDHATSRGLYLHFKLQENEMDDNRRGERGNGLDVPESLDGGTLGPERKLYCREIIARYAHNLALNWNIGEENTQITAEINDMVGYIRATDPYQHHVVIHTFPNQQDKVYPPLLGDASEITGVSLQNGWNVTHQRVLKWVRESTAAGRPWVVATDEQCGADTGVPPVLGYKGYDGKKKDGKAVQTIHDIRKATLWGNLMAGGAGVEYYFGYQLPENDLACQDWRSRDKSWDYARIALEFFETNKIPFWEMQNANALIGNSTDDNSKYCLAQPGALYLVYLPQGGETSLDLSGIAGQFRVTWFNPRDGGAAQAIGNAAIDGGGEVTIAAPSTDDWLAVIEKCKPDSGRR
jgi:hypothetical protein